MHKAKTLVTLLTTVIRIHSYIKVFIVKNISTYNPTGQMLHSVSNPVENEPGEHSIMRA